MAYCFPEIFTTGRFQRAEAVQVLDAFLTEPFAAVGVPAFIISGNHDSAERLAFGSSLMGKSGIYLSKVYDGTNRESSRCRMRMERCGFIFFRFCGPSTVRHALPERAEEIHVHGRWQ